MSLSFSVHISATVRFGDDCSVRLLDPLSVKSIPKCPGVYIMSLGDAKRAWEDDLVFYVGATQEQGLRERARRHRIALLGEIATPEAGGLSKNHPMRLYGVKLQHDIKDVTFTYCTFDSEASTYLPFAVEKVVTLEYVQKHGHLPEANKGSR